MRAWLYCTIKLPRLIRFFSVATLQNTHTFHYHVQHIHQFLTTFGVQKLHSLGTQAPTHSYCIDYFMHWETEYLYILGVRIRSVCLTCISWPLNWQATKMKLWFHSYTSCKVIFKDSISGIVKIWSLGCMSVYDAITYFYPLNWLFRTIFHTL